MSPKYAFALTAVIMSSIAAHADITIEEARTVAERAARGSLAGAEATRDETGGVATYHFRSKDAAGRKVGDYVVGASTGQLAYYELAPVRASRGGQSGEPITCDRALAIAEAEAERLGGSASAGVNWAVAPGRRGGWTVNGEGPLAGDPPRHGLSAEFTVDVLPDGALLAYSQRLPDPARTGLPVSVTREQAIATAQSAVAQPTYLPVEEPRLFEGRDGVVWTVELGDPAAPAEGRGGKGQPPVYIVRIDAQTGAVLETGGTTAKAPSKGTKTGLRHSGAVADPHHPFPWLALGAGAVALVLLLTGTALVVRRRRRAA